MNYPVNEIFATIQGEGWHTGRPAVFIRLQGCPVGCPWCDTKHTWAHLPGQQVELADIIDKPAADSHWAPCSPEELLEVVRDRDPIQHVVITGGEPCMFDLEPLTATLNQEGYFTQIETSGTFEVRSTLLTWVTVSPKLAMPGGFDVRTDALARADEIKMPVGKPRDLERLEALLPSCRANVHVCVQPLSLSPAATRLCHDTALKRGYAMSVQVHRILGWP
jgi:7-carboxy-7-deazaguanine synthase